MTRVEFRDLATLKVKNQNTRILENCKQTPEYESQGKRKFNIFEENVPNSQPFRQKIPKIEGKIYFSARFGMDPGEGRPAKETADHI